MICQGPPGNEKHLDLAQAVQHAGWHAVIFNYRRAWGNSGNFFQNLQNAVTVLRYLRTPSNVDALGIDTSRIVLTGHSMGGWVTATTAEGRGTLWSDPDLGA